MDLRFEVYPPEGHEGEGYGVRLQLLVPHLELRQVPPEELVEFQQHMEALQRAVNEEPKEEEQLTAVQDALGTIARVCEMTRSWSMGVRYTKLETAGDAPQDPDTN